MKTGLTPHGWVFLAVVATLAVAACSGCQFRRITDGSASYTSLTLGTNQTVAPFTLEAGKSGEPSYRKLDSKGVSSDQTSGLDIAFELGRRAGAAAVKLP
jgi:hypothetical protein